MGEVSDGQQVVRGEVVALVDIAVAGAAGAVAQPGEVRQRPVGGMGGHAITYEWVPAHDERVSEVRLLDSVAVVGPTHDDEQRAADNLLIRGDALHALRSLASLPEFRDEYLGKDKLCYIDPPFNSLRAFAQYDDALKHSVWLTMIRDRLEQIWKLLADDGVVWLHLDNNEVHRARMVLDGVRRQMTVLR